MEDQHHVLRATTPVHPWQAGGVKSVVLLLLIIISLAFSAYAYHLNGVIVDKFETRRWDIPARVYSRPLLLTPDAPIDKKALQTWLELLHYSASDTAPEQLSKGSYQQDGNTFTIATRGFAYGGSDIDPAQLIKIRFNKQGIAELQSNQPTDKPYLRLEPTLIGSIYPDSNEDRQIVAICAPKTQPSDPCLIKADYRNVIDALIATEDRNFYQHHGVSLRGTARALLNNIRGGDKQGGSTLTQQLIKNFYLNSERSLKRKVNEAIMALLLESHYTKETILQTYINEINLGQNGNQSINGFGIAAPFYFNKPLSDLSLAQSALLVGIAKGPSYYNPRKYPERALARRNLVLQNLLTTGKIDDTTYQTATQEPLGVVENPSVAKAQFPDFLDYVRRELNQRYKPDDLKTAGLKIITTLDPLAQIAADNAFASQLQALRKGKNKELQGALISAEPQTGAVVALIGSGSEFTGFNRALDAKRQVGSLLKPFIYLLALQSHEYNLASGVDDTEQAHNLSSGKRWTPKNYSGNSHGTVPMIEALANSYNQAAVNTGMRFGVNQFVDYMQQVGIQEPLPAYPSVFLGAVDLAPIQVLGAYQVLANGGAQAPLYAITSVIDEQANILEQAQIRAQQRLPADAVYVINYGLQQVVESGTAQKLRALGNNLAGKTGTTNDNKDAWFAGYSGNYVSVVWVGRDDNKPIGLTGGSGALPIWSAYMRALKLTPVDFVKPDSVEWAWLENGTGRASDPDCPEATYLPAILESISHEPSLCATAAQEATRQAELFAEFGAETASFDEMDVLDEPAPPKEPDIADEALDDSAPY